jgi:hypothetical protein
MSPPRQNGTPRGGKFLTERHLQDLRGSGLSGETIDLSGVYTERDPERNARLLGWEFPAKSLGDCLVFPFTDAHGSPTSYCRLKPDCPRIVDGVPAKYESPVGQPNRVYFPPLARAALTDSGVMALFCEGEKKALEADQNGFPAFGLVGCWGGLKPRGEDEKDKPRQLHDDFGLVTWADRRVYIVFDSDLIHNDQVRLAEWELARVLVAARAVVRVVRLPSVPGGSKVGVDDYLKEHGPGALRRLMTDATPPVEPPIGFGNTAKAMCPDDPAKTFTFPRAADELAVELVGRAGGWPRVVGGLLVVPDRGGRIRPLADHNDLFAYAGSVVSTGSRNRVRWDKGPGHVSRQEFFEHLRVVCERFDRADHLPHEPPIGGVLYTRPAPEVGGRSEALGRFLSFFNPASDVDASLLLACLLTPLWGGPAGKRPAFLFEAADDDPEAGRGVGKSTAAQKIARVYGGAFDVDPSEPFSRTRSRLLTPEAGAYRVLLMDNVKTFRLSSADLESLVTSPHLNGHRLYHGQAGVPNYFTLFLTINGASLSRDFAQRVVPVRFARATFRPGWESEADAFLDSDRDRLVADLVGVMRRPPAQLAGASRWGPWEAEVLARVKNPEVCRKAIAERTGGMDADREDADRLRETFANVVRREGWGEAGDSRFLLTSSAVTMLVCVATNARHTSAGAAAAHLKAVGVGELRKSDRNGQRRWLWTGPCYRPAPGSMASPRLITYDPERETWGLDSSADGESEMAT